MGTFSIWHWIVVLLVVVLVFGSGKLRNMGSDLGAAIKGFKKGMKEGEEPNNITDKSEETAETVTAQSTKTEEKA